MGSILLVVSVNETVVIYQKAPPWCSRDILLNRSLPAERVETQSTRKNIQSLYSYVNEQRRRANRRGGTGDDLTSDDVTVTISLLF